MKDERDVFDRKDWVSTLLPDDAATVLVRAAERARTLPVGSLARSKCLEVATQKVRFVYPRFFRFEEATPERNRAAQFGLLDREDEGGGQ